MQVKPLITIVGPTASGKTGLAIKIAKKYNGEVISADSRAVYRGLDIGTAKPDVIEQDGVTHWGIDIVNPDNRFTASDFKTYAVEKINDIRSRGKVPILVGGTGLYIDSVVYDFQFSARSIDIERRDELKGHSIEWLHEFCNKNNILLPDNKYNKRHVVNSILRKNEKLKRKHELDDDIIVVGISTEKDILKQRIIQRASTIFDSGVIQEALESANIYGWENEAMTGNVYRLIKGYVDGETSRSELIDNFIKSDVKLAKRQLTWFKRNEHIYWSSLDGAYTYIAQRLDEVNKL